MNVNTLLEQRVQIGQTAPMAMYTNERDGRHYYVGVDDVALCVSL